MKRGAFASQRRLIFVALALFFVIWIVWHSGADNTKAEGSVVAHGKNEKVVVLYWTTWFLTKWKVPTCTLPCEFTYDRTRLAEADVVLFHGADLKLNDLPSLKPRRVGTEVKGPAWVMASQENPTSIPALGDQNVMKLFHLLMTYRLDSDIPTPVFPQPDLNAPILPFAERTGLLFAALTNCEPVRTRYLERLLVYLGGKEAGAHSIGACAKNANASEIGLQVPERYGTDFKQAKTEGMRKYKFVAVFQNSDCDYFVDDQLYHAFQSATVPVFLGTRMVDEFLPPGGMRDGVIFASKFSGPRELAQYLQELANDEQRYNSLHTWRQRGYGDLSKVLLRRHWNGTYISPACRACRHILERKPIHVDGVAADPCRRRVMSDWLPQEEWPAPKQ
eukprot:TRINITY_DN3880_c0_g1_i1.p1 TRINITY_DN3880_c0_g1~~TRINITY_DN3880_c0_g1_i1.p1  ORF type:complete len:391 (-),score=42.84 TRINITY_DN3880_c0_g1_i1:13-1185(-)